MTNTKEYYQNQLENLRNRTQNIDYELEKRFKGQDDVLPKYAFIQRDSDDLKYGEVLHIYVAKPSTEINMEALDENYLNEHTSPFDSEDFGYQLYSEIILRLEDNKLYPIIKGDLEDEVTDKFISIISIFASEYDLDLNTEDLEYYREKVLSEKL